MQRIYRLRKTAWGIIARELTFALSIALFSGAANAQTITVTSPNGGESWQVGSQYDITWNDSGLWYVSLWYSTNGGSSWIQIASWVGNNRRYAWIVPNAPSTTCRVKVADAANNNVYDISNANFTIRLPYVNLTVQPRYAGSPFVGWDSKTWELLVDGASQGTSTGDRTVTVLTGNHTVKARITFSGGYVAETKDYPVSVPSGGLTKEVWWDKVGITVKFNGVTQASGYTLKVSNQNQTSPLDHTVLGDGVTNVPVACTWTGTGEVKTQNISYGTIGGQHLTYEFFPITASLSGTVTNARTGNPISGSIVSASGQSDTATTDPNGNYTLTLPTGTHTLVVTKAGYQSSSSPVLLTGSRTENFQLTPYVVLNDLSVTPGSVMTGGTIMISYLVSNSSSSPQTVWLGASMKSSAGETYLDDPSGDVSKTIPGSAGNYTVTRSFTLPSDARAGGYDIRGALWRLQPRPETSNDQYDLREETGQFTVTSSVAGIIYIDQKPLADVTVSLTGTISKSAQTNAIGAYSFANLPIGNYSVTPSKSGFRFDPPSRTYYPLTYSQAGQEFLGSDIAAPSIRILQPNGGEKLVAGNKCSIRWVATDNVGVSSVTMELSTDGGKHYETIASGQGNTGIYEWIITPTLTTQALIRISACDVSGLRSSDVSDGAFAISEGKPAAPSNLVASATSPAEVGIQWQDKSSNETGFTIERAPSNSGPWTTLQSVNAGTTTYSDRGLTSGFTYYYRVYAYNSFGNSGYSAVASATPINSRPASPSNLSAVLVLAKEIRLTWKRNSENEKGFTIERKIGTSGMWMETASVGPGIAVYGDGDLLSNATLYYRVYAFNDAGSSNCSNEVFLSTSPAPFDATVLVTRKGNPEVSAMVYLDNGSGMELRGVTALDGRLQVRGLKIGDKIRACKRIFKKPAAKQGHEDVDNTMYELWISSDKPSDENLDVWNGEYVSFAIQDQRNEYVLSLVHPIFKYNLMVSIESNVEIEYLNRLEKAFQQASRYLYNVTDGQAQFNKVAIYDNNQNCSNADIRIVKFWGNPSQLAVDGIYNGSFDPIFFRIPLNQIFIGEIWGSSRLFDPTLYLWRVPPDDRLFYTAIVHEFAHYAFGFYDEYKNSFNLDFDDHEYGLMDEGVINQMEASSWADYPRVYYENPRLLDDILVGLEVTRQLAWRKMPCWEWLQYRFKLEYPDISITIPPFGFREQGSARKRDYEVPAPPDPVTFSRHDFPGGSNQMTFRLQESERPISVADVYEASSNKLIYIGRTSKSGEILLTNSYTGNKLVYRRLERSTLIAGELDLNRHFDSSERIRTVIVTNRASPRRRIVANALIDSIAPGIAFQVKAAYDATQLTLSSDLWVDEDVASLPTVQYRCGSRGGLLQMRRKGSTKGFAGDLSIDLADTSFDGSGSLEFTILDSSGNSNNFISEFRLFPVSSTDSRELQIRNFEILINKSNISTTQVAAISCQRALPYLAVKQGLYLVSQMFSVFLSRDNSFPVPAGLNIYYSKEDITGMDEQSLRLYRWDENQAAWVFVPGSNVNVQRNVVSALVNSTGIYAVFASSLSNDSVPPAAINDLGAVTGDRPGKVVLTFTSPGDDGSTGRALSYILWFGRAEFTDANLDSMTVLPLCSIPKRGGARDTIIAMLPGANERYYFAVKSIDEAGNVSALSNGATAISGSMGNRGPTGVSQESSQAIRSFALLQNFPNPFNSTTTITYHLAQESQVSLKIYNVLGQLVASLANEKQLMGSHRVSWSTDLPSGIYFYRLQAGEFVETKKMILVR